MSQNAEKAKEIARRSGWRIRAVIKDGYARRGIVRAFLAGGIAEFDLSSARTAAGVALQDVPLASRGLVALHLPAEASAVAAAVSVSTHSSVATLQALHRFARIEPHNVLLAIRTSEDREGVSADAVSELDALLGASSAAGLRVRGVLVNFGCRVEKAPASHELRDLYRLASNLEAAIGRPQVFSLGGSVLLPCLPRPPSGMEPWLRVGEAIFAGSIPGAPNSTAFTTTFALEAKVIEVRERADSTKRILINHGASTFDPGDVVLEGARLFHASGECCAFDVPGFEAIRVGSAVRLSLGYKSAIRALNNPRVPVVWRRDRPAPKPKPLLASAP